MDEAASRDYPVREDMRFQRRSWLVERAGWLVLALIALAGLTGVFGSGPASWAHASAGPLTVSYDRFQRATRTTAFIFEVAHQDGGEVTLHIGAPFQRDFEVTSVQPAALRSRTGPDGIDLTFAAAGGGMSRIVIWAHARSFGLSRIDASANGGAPARLGVFIYP
jgi:hypothetical protein